MSGELPAAAAPRLFVSYAWSTTHHQAWVLDLAERLRGDGVDVILDKWDLTHGQDANAFMERMVTDPTVTKVLMICDRAYVDKANSRAGGVGTEAMIISPQFYRATDQTKFAAACVGHDDSGRALVPVFYQGRIYFDFTLRTAFEPEYESLLRWIFDKPRHVRPPLGARPQFIDGQQTHPTPDIRGTLADPSAAARAEAFRAARLVEIAARNTPAPLAAGAVAVLHMVPLPLVSQVDAVDIVAMVHRGAHMPLSLGGQGGVASVNLQGVCNAGGEEGYGQLFRTGAYEGTYVLKVDKDAPYVASIAFANMVVGAVRRTLALQAHYDFPFPTAAMLSFCNAERLQMRLRTEFGAGYYETRALGQPVVAIPHVLLSGPDIDVPVTLRPLLNATWNAFGQPACDVYDGQGKWIGVA